MGATMDEHVVPTDAPGTRRLPAPLIGAGVGAVAVALLLLIGLVVAGQPLAWDRAILLGLRAWHGPAWLPDAARDVTALGSGTVLTTVALAAVGLLLAQRHLLTALALAGAALSGSWAVALLKTQVGRPRPTIVEHWAVVHNQSFPSGHAASSALIYLTLAALASQVTSGRGVRAYLIGVAVLLTGAIGVSRVYLGVHWPSDVLAGWSFGTLWAIGWWQATATARRSLNQS